MLESNVTPLPMAPDDTFIALQRALAGRCSLERELGRGDTGMVYLAREEADRTIAAPLPMQRTSA